MSRVDQHKWFIFKMLILLKLNFTIFVYEICITISGLIIKSIGFYNKYCWNGEKTKQKVNLRINCTTFLSVRYWFTIWNNWRITKELLLIHLITHNKASQISGHWKMPRLWTCVVLERRGLQKGFIKRRTASRTSVCSCKTSKSKEIGLTLKWHYSSWLQSSFRKELTLLSHWRINKKRLRFMWNREGRKID